MDVCFARALDWGQITHRGGRRRSACSSTSVSVARDDDDDGNDWFKELDGRGASQDATRFCVYAMERSIWACSVSVSMSLLGSSMSAPVSSRFRRCAGRWLCIPRGFGLANGRRGAANLTCARSIGTIAGGRTARGSILLQLTPETGRAEFRKKRRARLRHLCSKSEAKFFMDPGHYDVTRKGKTQINRKTSIDGQVFMHS